MGLTHLDALNVAGVPTLGMSGIPATTGNVFFVNSVTGANGNSGAADQPLATIAAAYALCAADHGDIVVCVAGHKETVVAAGGITLAKSGVVIWGLGEGADRPTLTFSTSTAATVLITGANNQISNFVGVCGINGLVSPFVVQAADFTLGLEWHEGATSATQSVRVVLTSAAATRLNANVVFIGFTSGGTAPVNCIRLVGVAAAWINVDFYGIASTAIVEFATTACTDIHVTGYFYNSGTTNFSLNVVDTITGSTWAVQGFDGAAGLAFDGGSGKAVAGTDVSVVIANQAVPAPNSTANALERDVTGNKTDTGVTAVGTTVSNAAYIKGLVTMGTVQVANSTNNAFEGDVTGNKTDTSIDVVGTTKSIMAYVKGALDDISGAGIATYPAAAAPANAVSVGAVLREIYNQADKSVVRATAVLANGNTLFTIAGGSIQIMELMAICITANDATATTLQFSSSPTVGSATTISGATAALTSATAGTTVLLTPTALSTAPTVVAASSGGVQLGLVAQNHIIVNAGTITSVIATGPSTGTWSFVMRYRPLNRGVTVV